jgi:cold shock CspA family protein
MNTGKVKLYKKDEGYGVITPEDRSQDIVFREIRCIGIEELAEGRRVSYKEEVSQSSGKVEAVDVVVL